MMEGEICLFGMSSDEEDVLSVLSPMSSVAAGQSGVRRRQLRQEPGLERSIARRHEDMFVRPHTCGYHASVELQIDSKNGCTTSSLSFVSIRMLMPM